MHISYTELLSQFPTLFSILKAQKAEPPQDTVTILVAFLIFHMRPHIQLNKLKVTLLKGNIGSEPSSSTCYRKPYSDNDRNLAKQAIATNRE